MKLFEFYNLYEYKQDVTLQRFGDKLANTAQANNETDDPQEVITRLEAMDPTKNKQYVVWLVKQYTNKLFRLEDAGRIKAALSEYHQLKPRLPQDKRDINRLSIHQVEELVDSTKDVDLDQETDTDIDGAEVLYDGPHGVLAVPKTEEASCELGSGTKWCTAARENNMFRIYNEKGPLYVWIENPGNKKYQLHFESAQFMDAQDRPIESEKIREWRSKHPVLSKLFAKKEKDIMKNGDSAYAYARDIIKDRWLEAEPYIMKNGDSAYAYARDIIKDRWPEAEPYLIKSPVWAYAYIVDIIKDRWPEAEPYLIKSPVLASYYARDIIKGRWPEAEPYLIKSPDWAYYYARDIIKGRWPEAEKYIRQDEIVWEDYRDFLKEL